MRTPSWFSGIAACLLSVLMLAPSCMEPSLPQGNGALSIVIPDLTVLTTKAGNDTEFLYEKVLNQVQVMLFKDGKRIDYLSLDGQAVSFPYTRLYPSLAAGSYQVYAVANGPDVSSLTQESDLLSHSISLTDCGLTAETGFVMAGSAPVMVEVGSAARATLDLTRFASRVRVTSIQNRVPVSYADGGVMTVKGIFLVNALGSWNLGGTGSPSSWLNLGGRVAGKAASMERSDFITSAAQVPAAFRSHLFRQGSHTIAVNGQLTLSDACLYSFPNAMVTDHPGATAAEAGAPARLVVLARVNGKDWWYPVTLCKDGQGLERNTSYDVSLVICATGSADPNEPVTEAQMQAHWSPSGWTSGTSYSEPM